MAVRSILTLFSGAPGEDSAVDYALRLAESFGAHLDCLHVSPNPEQVLDAYIDMPSGLIGKFVEDIEKVNSSKLATAQKRFSQIAEKLHVPVIDQPKQGQRVSASFRPQHGFADKILEDCGKTCDIIVLPRDIGDVSPDYSTASTHALFETGVPTMYVPPVEFSEPLRTACIAWNGSREAARALHYALPLLEKANEVHILSIQKSQSEGVPMMEPVMRFLNLHGIKAQSSVLHKNTSSTAEIIVEKVASLKADLLVMGAYSHNRFRQSVLGGVTSHMLKNTSFPVLMAH